MSNTTSLGRVARPAFPFHPRSCSLKLLIILPEEVAIDERAEFAPLPVEIGGNDGTNFSLCLLLYFLSLEPDGRSLYNKLIWWVTFVVKGVGP